MIDAGMPGYLCEPDWCPDIKVHLLHLWLHSWHNLDCRCSRSQDSHSIIFPLLWPVAVGPSRGMEQLTLERLEALYLFRILPRVQQTVRADQYVTIIVLHFACQSIADVDIPLALMLVPNARFNDRIKVHELAHVEAIDNTKEVAIDVVRAGEELGPICVERKRIRVCMARNVAGTSC